MCQRIVQLVHNPDLWTDSWHTNFSHAWERSHQCLLFFAF